MKEYVCNGCGRKYYSSADLKDLHPYWLGTDSISCVCGHPIDYSKKEIEKLPLFSWNKSKLEQKIEEDYL